MYAHALRCALDPQTPSPIHLTIINRESVCSAATGFSIYLKTCTTYYCVYLQPAVVFVTPEQAYFRHILRTSTAVHEICNPTIHEVHLRAALVGPRAGSVVERQVQQCRATVRACHGKT